MQRRKLSRLGFDLPRPLKRVPLGPIGESSISKVSHSTQRIVEITQLAATLPISRETITFATKLLDQQMWCWGQDVIRPKGNALIDYGFQRYSPKASAGEKAIGHYILKSINNETTGTRSEFTVGLWGSGVYFGEPELGGVYIRRFGFAGVAMNHNCPVECIDAPDEFIPYAVPPESVQQISFMELFKKACRWMAAYETWCLNRLGLEYRQQCLKNWNKAIVNADQTSSAWCTIADALQRACEGSSAHN